MRPACSCWVLCTSALIDPTIEITFGILWHNFPCKLACVETQHPLESAMRVVLSRTSP